MNKFREMFMVSAAVLGIALRKKEIEDVREFNREQMSGSAKVQSFLEGPSSDMYEIFRLDKDAFVLLCNHFKEMGYLEDSKYLSVEEKMMIFLATVGHNLRHRLVRHMFNHSTQTINKYFHQVLGAMMEFAKEMIVPPSSWDTPSEEIHSYRRLREGPFKGAVGALDGTLISAVIPVEHQIPWRSRGGGECYQNVLAVCDFDMKFTFVVAGWEGVAHDSRVLHEAVNNPAYKFPMPPDGKYYLCDAAYAHTRGFMAPYRGVRYWLKDYRRSRATGKKEKYNRAHAQLRNVIERSFGVLKARFPILKTMASFSFPVQRDIVHACMALHNFIRKNAAGDPLFNQVEETEIEGGDSSVPVGDSSVPVGNPSSASTSRTQDQRLMVNLRDQIADELDAGLE